MPIWDNIGIFTRERREKKHMKMSVGFDKHVALLPVAILAGAAITTSADTEYFWRGTADNPVWDDTSPNWTLNASRGTVRLGCSFLVAVHTSWFFFAFPMPRRRHRKSLGSR